jgi:L-asparagine oxygenase
VEIQTISPLEAERVRAGHSRFIGCSAYSEKFLTENEQATRSALPEKVVSSLSSMVRDQGPPAFLIRGLAAEHNLPPTPTRTDSVSDAQLSFVSEIVLLGVAKVLGEPLGYKAEKNGALVQNVFPIETQSHSPSNESSSSVLDLHTELVFSRRKPTCPLDAESPDFILLWCLRGDPDGTAETLVAAIEDLCALLGPSDLSVLSQARFELRAPYSFTRDEPGNRPWVGPVPVLRGTNSQRLAAFDLACGTRGIDETAEKALNELRRAAKEPGITRRIALESEDLLILNNRRIAHGRTPFSARFDGTDRWMLRVYVRRSLSDMRPVDQAFPRIF